MKFLEKVVAFGLGVAIWGQFFVLRRGGADMQAYMSWSDVFLKADLFQIKSEVLSPSFFPLSQWSFGPGLFISLSRYLGSPFLLSWMLVPLCLIFLFFFLERFGLGKKESLVCLITLLMGSHLGVYSFEYSSESFGIVFFSALLVLSFVEVPFYGLLFGSTFSLLLLTRSQLVLFTLPLFVHLYRKRKKSFIPMFFLPLLIGFVMMMMANYWMTGNILKSPYQFSDYLYSSFHLWSPKLKEILFHPLHGLVLYHPLVFISFCLNTFFAFSDRKSRDDLYYWNVTSLMSVMLSAYLHSCWYVWWLGMHTYGMRGLSLSAFLLFPISFQYIRRKKIEYWAYPSLLFGIIWTYCWMPHPYRPHTSFFSWGEVKDYYGSYIRHLWQEKKILGIMVHLLTARFILQRKVDFKELFLATTSSLFLFYIWGKNIWPICFLLPFLLSFLEQLSIPEEILKKSLGFITVLFLLSVLQFSRLALTRQARAKVENYQYMGRVQIRELEGSLSEYRRMKGYLKEKRALSDFIEREKQRGKLLLEQQLKKESLE